METKVIEELRWATAARAKIKLQLDKLNAELKAVNDVALKAMEEGEVSTWADNFGTLSIKLGYEVTTLKKEKLIEAMMLNGIPAAVIEKVIKAGSSVSERKACVEFRPVKVEE